MQKGGTCHEMGIFEIVGKDTACFLFMVQSGHVIMEISHSRDIHIHSR